MILFYELALIAMVSSMAICLYKKSCVNVLCLLISVNFLTFLVLYYSPLEGGVYAVSEAIRTSAVMLTCGVFAYRSKKPKPYLFYSLVLYGFIFVNGLFLINPAFAPDELLIALTLVEIIIFINGHLAALQAKTKNDIPDYTNVNNDNTTRSRFISNS